MQFRLFPLWMENCISVSAPLKQGNMYALNRLVADTHCSRNCDMH